MERLDRRSTWAIGVILLLALFLLLSRCAGGSGTTRVGSVPNNQGPAEPAPAPTSTRGTGNDEADDTDTPDRSGGEPAVGAGEVLVDGAPLLPYSIAEDVGRGDDLSRLNGKRAVARRAQVLSVPADEGFWIGISGRDRVWVQLVGPPPESPYTVSEGDLVSFSGRMTRNGSGFARSVGVSRSEGAARLTAQREHISVAKRSLDLDQP